MAEKSLVRGLVALFGAMIVALAVLGASAEEESADACEDACESSEMMCAGDCEESEDPAACESACADDADACYEDCG